MHESAWEEFTAEPLAGYPGHEAPECPVGIYGHEWTLTVEWGELSLSSGCESCDFALDNEYLMVGDIKGRLKFGADHPDLGGWHGMTRCDCNWWYEFTPSSSSEEEEERRIIDAQLRGELSPDFVTSRRALEVWRKMRQIAREDDRG